MGYMPIVCGVGVCVGGQLVDYYCNCYRLQSILCSFFLTTPFFLTTHRMLSSEVL